MPMLTFPKRTPGNTPRNTASAARLLDPKPTLARKYGATVMPEVVVVSAKGELL